MRIFSFVTLILSFTNIYNVSCLNIKRPIVKNKVSLSDKINKNEVDSPQTLYLQNKFDGFIELLRPKSVLPTIVLSLTGGWIMNPSIYNLLHSVSFLTAVATTSLTLFSSMIANDIYDIRIDELNNPTRPLVSGKVKLHEAVLLYAFIVFLTEVFGFTFLTHGCKDVLTLVLLVTTIYTPVLKRIPLIKNLSCAWVVSLTPFFSGLSVIKSVVTPDSLNFGLLSILMSIVFYGSLTNEILLDIRDYSGDEKNKIYTIPVIFGKEASFVIASIITNLNIVSNSFSLAHLINPSAGILLFIICSPLSFNVLKLRDKNYSKEKISNVVNETTKPLLVMLFYFLILAKYFCK
jgi:geranylgeranylglycerol-phosphate geranylgeranyltransferase